MSKLFTKMSKEEQKDHTSELYSALTAQAETLTTMNQKEAAKEALQAARYVQRRYQKSIVPKPKAKKKEEPSEV